MAMILSWSRLRRLTHSTGTLSRAKAKRLYLSGEIEPFELAA
jgi:hypothetical protein